MTRIYWYVCLFFVLVLIKVQIHVAEEGVVQEEESSGDCGCSAKLSRQDLPSAAIAVETSSNEFEVEELGGRILSVDEAGPTIDMVFIEGGDTFMGTNKPILMTDGEGPLRTLTLSPYLIDRYAVSNEGNACFSF